MVACLLVVIVAGVIRQRRDAEPVIGPDFVAEDKVASKDKVEVPPPVVDPPSLSEALGLTEEDMTVVGGVERPKRDILQTKHDPVAIRAKYLASLPKVGVAPSVSKEDSPAAAKLLEEAAKKDGERRYLSTSSKTEPFDRDAYLASPEDYLVLTRPGRIRQSLAPAKGVVPLRSQGGQFFQILQGESVFLSATAEPGMPVTFHTQQLGEFDNRLKTISVAADKEGVAKVKYHAVTGVVGVVQVMAASPVHSGRLDYVVEVSVGGS